MNQSPLVAILDDDADILSSLESFLVSHGYRTATFETAHVLLEAMPTLAPACIVTDYQMPAMNGLELAEHLAGAGCTVPIILISAYLTVQAGRRAQRAGVAHVLDKPCDLDALLTHIGDLTGRTT